MTDQHRCRRSSPLGSGSVGDSIWWSTGWSRWPPPSPIRILFIGFDFLDFLQSMLSVWQCRNSNWLQLDSIHSFCVTATSSVPPKTAPSSLFARLICVIMALVGAHKSSFFSINLYSDVSSWYYPSSLFKLGRVLAKTVPSSSTRKVDFYCRILPAHRVWWNCRFHCHSTEFYLLDLVGAASAGPEIPIRRRKRQRHYNTVFMSRVVSRTRSPSRPCFGPLCLDPIGLLVLFMLLLLLL